MDIPPLVTAWDDDAPTPASWPSLGKDISADVCVVGGGIAGLTTAYLCGRAGLSVALIDAGRSDGGETGRSSAHLANALDDRFHELERLHGVEGARIAAGSHGVAIDLIQQIVQQFHIDCGFRRIDGYLFAAPGSPTEEIEQERAAATRAGLRVSRLDRVPGLHFDTGPCLRFADQAQIDPRRYLAGLAHAAATEGARLYGRTRAVSIHGGRDAHVITSDGKRISAGSVVVATNVPVNDRLRVHPMLRAYRTYVVALRVPRGSVPTALYWDTGEPYHYVRIVEGGPYDADLLLVGGEDHMTGQGPADPDEPYEKLEAWARERFPLAETVACRWSGQIIEPVDGLALIGRNQLDSDNVYIIAGDSGNGMTHGTVGGILVRDLIVGQPSAWEHLYRPTRMHVGAAGEFLRVNANMIGQYADWVSGADVASLDDVPRGVGALVRHGMSKWAAYRDDDGNLHVCSAICPHLGGLVRWNPTERSWDCPCHGSRFDAHGKVVNGPANTDLTPVQVPAQIPPSAVPSQTA